MTPIADAWERQSDQVRAVQPEIASVLGVLDPQKSVFTLEQALVLAALVLDRRPDLIIDLGTGSGCSSAAFAIACARANVTTAVDTFDLRDVWGSEAGPKLATLDRTAWAPIRQRVGDLTDFDFPNLIAQSRSILIFWDAHGYKIADAVLGIMMPLVADRHHLVICHDMTDNRFHNDSMLPYDNKPFWRGSNDWSGEVAFTNLGWVASYVEQCIPILDFCYRNRIELGSADHELQSSPGPSPLPLVHITYFTLEESQYRNFPAPMKKC